MNLWLTSHFTPLDLLAVAIFFTAWMGYGAYAERNYHRKRNLLKVMNDFRLQWMREMLRRDNRMVDASMIGNLLRSISFFASTSIFILAGLLTLLTYREKAVAIIDTIPFATEPTAVLWEAKVFLLAIVFVYGFFKFTWSLRQYNYACIFVGAAPKPHERVEEHEHIAQQGGRLIANAAKHFNMGLRAYYYGMAALAWFIHPLALIAVTLWVVGVLYRREFRSRALATMEG